MKKVKNKIIVPLFKVFMSKNIDNPLKKVIHSGYIGQGPKVNEFEEKLQKFIGNPFIFTVNNGTSALHLALRLAGIKYGDEVITTPMTCTATNWAILHHGANLVWSDIDPSDGNISPRDIQKKITNNTKAIVVVDWGGTPCDILKIKKIAGNIPIIEDSAHGFGSVYNKKKVGNWADYTCFSFQAIKHLTTGDGGAIAVKNKKDFDRGILLRWYGIDRYIKTKDERIEVDIKEWGYKFHMNDINAIIGIENLKYINKILFLHRSNASYYNENLKNINGLKTPVVRENDISSYWLYTIRVKQRLAFMEFMRDHGIFVSQVHRRNDTHPVVLNFSTPLPGVDEFTKEMVCIPVGW